MFWLIWSCVAIAGTREPYLGTEREKLDHAKQARIEEGRRTPSKPAIMSR